MLRKHRVFTLSATFVGTLVIIGAAVPQRFRSVAETLLDELGHYFGWFYLISTFVFVVFLLVLAMSRYGKIRLGPQDCSPDYGVFSWLSMLLSAGFGVGLVFYGMAEPIQHLMTPPHRLAEPGSARAAEVAMQYSFFHWGLSQWAAFSLVGLIIAFFQFRKDRPGLVSTMVEPVTKELPRRQLISDSLDVLAVVATGAAPLVCCCVGTRRGARRTRWSPHRATTRGACGTRRPRAPMASACACWSARR